MVVALAGRQLTVRARGDRGRCQPSGTAAALRWVARIVMACRSRRGACQRGSPRTVFTLANASSPAAPSSRPYPLALTPPNGNAGSEITG